MSDFLKMDVFFVVTTLAVIVVTGLLVYAFVYVLRILKNMDRISQMVGDEGELIRGDIADLRTNIREEGFKVKHISRVVKSAFSRYSKGKGD